MTLLISFFFVAKLLPSLSAICGFSPIAFDFAGFHRILMDYEANYGSPRYFTMRLTWSGVKHFVCLS